MDVDDVVARLRHLAESWLRSGALKLGVDDVGGIILWARVDLTHLDADALSDRLAAWARRVAGPQVHGAEAFVSFRHARPATSEEAELDIQEKWHDLEPTLRLEMSRRAPTAEEVGAFAALIPGFLEQVGGAGRPAGWRVVDEGNAE